MLIPDAAIGSILAAMIAGLVVFISTVLAKEQKTSEFRQAWIDELRKDVAQYVSGTIEFAALYSLKKKNKVGEVEFLEENFDAIRDLQSIEYRIIFRLNPVKHANLISKLKGLRSQMISLYDQGMTNKGLEAAITDAITDDCKVILKNEWERVKKGESGFRFVKWAAMGIAIAGLLASLLYLHLRSQASEILHKVQTTDQKTQAGTSTSTPFAITTGEQSVYVNIAAPTIPCSAQKLPTKGTVPLVSPPSKVPVRCEPPTCSVVTSKCPTEP